MKVTDERITPIDMIRSEIDYLRSEHSDIPWAQTVAKRLEHQLAALGEQAAQEPVAWVSEQHLDLIRTSGSAELAAWKIGPSRMFVPLYPPPPSGGINPESVWLRTLGTRIQVLVEFDGVYRVAIEEGCPADLIVSHNANFSAFAKWPEDDLRARIEGGSRG